MNKTAIFAATAFIAVTALVAVLYHTLRDPAGQDACFDLQRDVGAAVLADGDADQEILINRAIIVRGNCEQNEQD